MKGVSVIVCCFNSARVIENTMHALIQQTDIMDQPCEIIVVDNNCTDDTVARVREMSVNRATPVRILKENQPGLVHARKTGAFAAQYDIAVFIDDDNIMDSGWIERIAACFDELPQVGVIGGYAEPCLRSDKVPHWFMQFQLVYACGPQAEVAGPLGDKLYVYGAGIALRTDLLQKILADDWPMYLTGRIGDASLRGEDTEICIRAILLGSDIYYNPSLRMRHHLLPERLTWKALCQMKYGGGLARPFLSQYGRLARGNRTASYVHLVAVVIINWLRFFRWPPNWINCIRTGRVAAVRFRELAGMTHCILFYRRRLILQRIELETRFQQLPERVVES